MTAALSPRRPAALPLVRTPAFEEASARLSYLVEQGSRVGLLLGPSGIGKTTLLQRFADEQRRAGCLTALVNAAGLSPEELLWAIAEKLQATVEHDWNLFRLWRALNDRLVELRFLREQAVILVDDAGSAASDVLVHLYRLLHADAAADARLSVVLVATRGTMSKLGRSLLDLVDLRSELPTWTTAETGALIDAVGRTRSPLPFTDEAVRRVQQLSGGVPRSILRLAELGRLAAETEGRDTVDGATIEGVEAEFGIQHAA